MKTVLRILTAPITLIISLLVWLFAALFSRTVFLWQIASAVLGLLALAVLLTVSVKNGLILFALALTVSPIGLPMLVAKLLGGLQRANMALKELLHN
ncbi:MAG: succinate dehydrogenase [Clostridia bacterium]|nr:succinate dehydrogenase [Clostridia bacterium]